MLNRWILILGVFLLVLVFGEAAASSSTPPLSSDWLWIPSNINEASLLSAPPDQALLKRLEGTSLGAEGAGDWRRALQTYRREHLAYLKAYVPKLEAIQRGEALSEPHLYWEYPATERALQKVIEGDDVPAEAHALYGMVLANKPQGDLKAAGHLRAFLRVTEAQGGDPDWIASVSLLETRVEARRFPTDAALIHSPRYAGLLLLDQARRAQSNGRNDQAERRLIALFRWIQRNGGVEGRAPLLLREQLLALGSAGAKRVGGWLRLTDVLEEINPLPYGLEDQLLDLYRTQASGQHRARLHLHLFQRNHAAPKANDIEHLEAIVERAEELSAPEGDALCQDVLTALRKSGPWWRDHGFVGGERGLKLLRRCLPIHAKHFSSAMEEPLLIERIESIDAQHEAALRPEDHALLGAVLFERGEPFQAYDHFSKISAKEVPKRLQARVFPKMVSLHRKVHEELHITNQSCDLIGDAPTSASSAKLQSLLKLASPFAKSPERRAEHLRAEIESALSEGSFEEALKKSRALLKLKDSPENLQIETLQGVVACLSKGQKWRTLSALGEAIDRLPNKRREELLDFKTRERLILGHIERAQVLEKSGSRKRAIALLEGLEDRWRGEDLSPQFFWTSAEFYRLSGALTKASRRYETLYITTPQSPLADDALFIAGLIAQNHGATGVAYELFGRILKEHPGGSHMSRATDELEAMESKQTQKEKHQ